MTDSEDNWAGYIPFDEMPHSLNPERGWVGTCNHKTITKDYPYYYSSHLSPSYRYERLKQLLDTPNPKTAENHWQYQRDTVNLMAKRIAPLMAKALWPTKRQKPWEKSFPDGITGMILTRQHLLFFKPCIDILHSLFFRMNSVTIWLKRCWTTGTSGRRGSRPWFSKAPPPGSTM